MNQELSWDDDSVTYDSIYHWDSAEPGITTTTTMKYKAIIDYTKYANVQIASIAQIAHDSFVAHAATFDNPPLTMAIFQTKITAFEGKIVARASNAKADVLALSLARTDMLTTLNAMGSYVNTVAQGDPVMVQNGGLPYYSTSRTPLPQPPAAPQNLRLSHGTGTGIVIARHTSTGSYNAHQAQVNLGDPSVEADWQPRASYLGGRVVLTGFTAGALLYVRARTVGRGGALSNWSNIAQITVI